MTLLTLFLLRLSSGMALGMALASPRQTPSGYFRNHLYVVLGLCALAAMLSRGAAPQAFPWALAAAAISYAGAVCWLYEKAVWGVVALILACATAQGGSWEAARASGLWSGAKASAEETPDSLAIESLRQLQGVGSSALLGVTMASMLLGHWYLNAPGMALGPLERLIKAMYAAVGLQAAACGLGLGLQATRTGFSTTTLWWLFVTMRWTFGIFGVAATAWMARQTLRIPNTQSATGILYVAVIGTFVGEVVSILLSTEAVYPL